MWQKSSAVLLNFLFICESWKIKCITVSTKILCSTTVFNIDNNQKCFLSSKSAYYYDFWRSCDTEDWSNDAENTALITEINYSLTDIHIENSFLNCNNISLFFTLFYQINAALVSRRDSKILNNIHDTNRDLSHSGKVFSKLWTNVLLGT